MAKPVELPTNVKALQKMVEDLRLELAQAQQKAAADDHAHEQAIERLKEEHEAALESAAAVAREASEVAGRAISSADEMSGNRDLWVDRSDRARALIAQALAVMDGLDRKPEGETEEEPIPLPPAPEPEEPDVEG